MKLGYLRVSTINQNYDIQMKALIEAGVDEKYIYKEKESGKSLERFELQKLLAFLREGDELVVYDLSRLGRSSKQVYDLLERFNKEGINFISLKENIDLKTPTGRFMATILSAINQLDLEIRNEKTKEGLERAKAKGVKFGRPPVNPNLIKRSLDLYDKGLNLTEVCEATHISKSTLSRAIKKRKET